MLGPKGAKDNSRRRGIPAQRKEQRRKDAEARQEKYNQLSPKEKLIRAGAKQRKRFKDIVS